METPSPPPDVRLARAIRALRDALIGAGAACLGLAVVASAILALSDSDAVITGPVLTLLGGGQLLALVAAVLCAIGLRGVLTGRPIGLLLVTTRARLRWVARAVLGWCVGAAAMWVLTEPASALISLALAAVTAQLAVVLVVLGRRLVPQGEPGAPTDGAPSAPTG